MIKIVYGILCHKSEEQMIELIESLKDKENFIVIHIDKKSEESLYRNLEKKYQEYSNIHFLKKQRKIYWGHESIIYATLDMIKYIVNEKNIEFNYMTLLTGQDFPVKSATYINNYLSKVEYEYINLWGKLPINVWEKNEERVYTYVFSKYFFRTYKKFEMKNFEIKFLLNKLINKIIYSFLSFKVKKTNIIKWYKNNKIELYGGSQMWTLSKLCLKYILEFCEKNPEYLKSFKYSFGSDEIFFQTIIMNSPFRLKVKNQLHYIEYGNIENLVKKEVISKLENKDILYARKFDIKDEDSKQLINYIKEKFL